MLSIQAVRGLPRLREPDIVPCIISLQAAIDHYCDKLAVERRSSEVLSTELNDDGPVYHALSVHLSRAKSTTRWTIDLSWRNFLSPGFGAKFERKVPLFLEIPVLPFNTV